MSQFEIGKSYEARSAFDYDCIFTIKVVRRTANTVTAFVSGTAGAKTFRVKVAANGVEFVRSGNYSMAPVFYANKVAQ